ncbi:MAG: hypothetical protein ABFS32_18915, partial [Bacteroidota bacterium]
HFRKYTLATDSWDTVKTVDTADFSINFPEIKVNENSNAILSWDKGINDGGSGTIDTLNAVVYNDSKGTFGPIKEFLENDINYQGFDILADIGNDFSIFYSLTGPDHATQHTYDFNAETWNSATVIYEFFGDSYYAVTSNSIGERVLSGVSYRLVNQEAQQYVQTSIFLP